MSVSTNKKMLEYGFLHSISKRLAQGIELTDEQLANIELALADIQSAMPAAGSVTEEEMITAEIAAQMAVQSLLAANLSAEQLAALKGKPITVGKPVDQPTDETAEPAV